MKTTETLYTNGNWYVIKTKLINGNKITTKTKLKL